MLAQPQHKMTVDEYLAWAEGQPGRYELCAGRVYPLAPEGAGPRVKFAVQSALLAGIRRTDPQCHMLPNGMTVRVAPDTAHEPDALIYCGPQLPNSAIEVPNPLLVVEVLSPSTRHIDASAKLAGYFRLASVQHFLIVDPEEPLVIHHARGENGIIATRIARDGSLRLDPPGLELAIADLYPATE